MKANIIYKLSSVICRDGQEKVTHEETYDELCDARYDLNTLLKFAKPRADKEREEGHDSYCNVLEKVFDTLLPDVDVTVQLVGERNYFRLTYEIKPL